MSIANRRIGLRAQMDSRLRPWNEIRAGAAAFRSKNSNRTLRNLSEERPNVI